MDKRRILHFDEDMDIKDIEEAMSYKKGVYYYTRYFIDKNELHIVKNDEEGVFKIHPFVISLLEHYKKDNINIVSGLDIKGNDKFTILKNCNTKLVDSLRDSLNKLLTK